MVEREQVEVILLIASLIACGIILGVIISIFIFPPQIINSNLTTTLHMNSDSGILIINATFTNPNYVPGDVIYSNYTINSAKEELPNGNIINASDNYAYQQVQISCHSQPNGVSVLPLNNGSDYIC
jgi:hypothetical protein